MLEQLRNICLSSLLIIFPAIAAAILVFRNTIIRRLHQGNFPENLQFADTELIITPSQPLRRTILLGSALYVPQDVNAVVARNSPGNRTLFEPGDYIITDFRSAVLFYKYVNITLRNLTIMVEDAPTIDGFNISIWLRISYRVVDPEEVANLDDPVLELIMLIEDAVRGATIRFSHNQLIPTPQSQPISNQELINWIRPELVARAAAAGARNANDIEFVRGIVLRSIVIQERIADPNRRDPPRRPNEAERLVREAETRERIAVIENRIRLLRARTTLQEDKILNPVWERELNRELRRAKPRLDIERERVRVQACIALLPMLQIITQIRPYLRSNRLYYYNYNQLYYLLEEICRPCPKKVRGRFNSDSCEPMCVDGGNGSGPRPPENAREKLVYQLADLWSLPSYVGHRLHETPNGNLVIIIQLGKKFAGIWYDVSGSNPRVERIILVRSNGVSFDVPNPNIYNVYTITELIQKLDEKYGPE